MNNCTFHGRLAKEHTFRVSESGQQILNNTIAVNTGYGQNKDTLFIEFSLFGKQAEYVANYSQKGNRIIAIGEIRMDKWTAKDGTEKQTLRLRANTVELVDMKPKEDGGLLAGSTVVEDDDLPF